MRYFIFTLLIAFGLQFLPLHAAAWANEHDESVMIDEYYRYSGSHQDSIINVLRSKDYEQLSTKVVNLGLSSDWSYVKFHFKNTNYPTGAFFYIDNPCIGNIELYKVISKAGLEYVELLGKDGAYIPYNERPNKTTSFLFDLKLPIDEEGWYLMKVKSEQQVLLSGRVNSELELLRNSGYADNKIYLYMGIIFALIAYNIFLAFSTRDSENLLYIFYLLSVGMVQINNSGIGATSFWPNSEWFCKHSLHLFGLLSGLFTILFVRQFIRTKQYTPIIDKIILFYIVINILAIPLIFTGHLIWVYNLINFTAISSFILVVAGIVAIRKGSITARYFIVAWSIFLISVTIFALKDFGIFPYNMWTVNAVAIGSAVEGILLSFAIANKINILKKQKEEASAELIKTVTNQNEILETKVHERTEELEQAKDKIQAQYDDLRITQKQLVESEKMAGLGQMTAGIAHELNNPINFVSSNVAPLHRDVKDVVTLLDDYVSLGEKATPENMRVLKEKYDKIGIDFVKQEIEALLKGIEEGSRRTAEIVKGLRVFSRTDKDELVLANLNECLQSTLVVMKSVTKGQVTITKDLGANIPNVYCYPGKLNQVIVNLVTNAVHATNIAGRNYQNRLVHVRSYSDENYVYISVKDNGTGIDESVREKIFMPFFTTKAVGEGTGLGLSITMGIVEEHNGEIEVISERGSGSEFIIHLPRIEGKQNSTAA